MNLTQEVYNILSTTNENNPITAKSMSEQLGTTVPKIREAVTTLRAQKIKIHSSSKGYYIPSDIQNLPSAVTCYTGPYRITIIDGSNRKIMDCEYTDHLYDIRWFKVKAKLYDGRMVTL